MMFVKFDDLKRVFESGEMSIDGFRWFADVKGLNKELQEYEDGIRATTKKRDAVCGSGVEGTVIGSDS